MPRTQTIFIIAQREHKFVTCLGVLGDCETAGADGGGEAVVGEGRGHDVEGWSAGGGEEREDVLEFDEGTGPCPSASLTSIFTIPISLTKFEGIG